MNGRICDDVYEFTKVCINCSKKEGDKRNLRPRGGLMRKSEIGILTVYELMSTLYTSGTRSVPGSGT
jgi:hypothetical protein